MDRRDGHLWNANHVSTAESFLPFKQNYVVTSAGTLNRISAEVTYTAHTEPKARDCGGIVRQPDCTSTPLKTRAGRSPTAIPQRRLH